MTTLLVGMHYPPFYVVCNEKYFSKIGHIECRTGRNGIIKTEKKKKKNQEWVKLARIVYIISKVW